MPLKVLGNEKRGRAFILSGPAGTGKTTLVNMLSEEFPFVKESISFTTRKKRSNEIPGEHYNFLDEKEFKKRIDDGEFLEYVQLFGNYYGTSKRWVEERQEQGIHVILTIDTQGALHIQKQKLLSAVFVFISPPSFDELGKRLRERKTETEEMIQTRLIQAEKELAVRDQYDYNITNDDLTTAYDVLKSILIAEEHRIL